MSSLRGLRRLSRAPPLWLAALTSSPGTPVPRPPSCVCARLIAPGPEEGYLPASVTLLREPPPLPPLRVGWGISGLLPQVLVCDIRPDGERLHPLPFPVFLGTRWHLLEDIESSQHPHSHSRAAGVTSEQALYPPHKHVAL